MLRTFICLVIAAAFGIRAAEPPVPPADDGHGWKLISGELIQKLLQDGKKIGYPGQTTGLAVDRTTGELYLVVPDQGVWKSTDRGQTFARVDGGAVTGRCETGYTINADPNGKRLAFFMLDGKCAMTLDAGATWLPFTSVGRNWDFAAVDWATEKPQAIFAALHESGGQLMATADAGKTWTKLDKDLKYTTVGVIDATTFLTTRGEGILRSTDAGKTWTKVSDLQPVGQLMQNFAGAAWWVGKDAMLVSRDKGLTWAKWGAPLEGCGWGPWFGKDEKQVMVAGKKGFMETTDGGQTWKLAAPLAAIKGFDAGRSGWFLNLAWDPRSDTFYECKMGGGAYRYERR
ncbi:MAG: hypothetical protein ACHRHE_12350 [Tepidisphaerales bacterium]